LPPLEPEASINAETLVIEISGKVSVAETQGRGLDTLRALFY